MEIDWLIVLRAALDGGLLMLGIAAATAVVAKIASVVHFNEKFKYHERVLRSLEREGRTVDNGQ